MEASRLLAVGMVCELVDPLGKLAFTHVKIGPAPAMRDRPAPAMGMCRALGNYQIP